MVSLVTNDDELLDLVDATDTVIGTVWRSQYGPNHADKHQYIRAAQAFIINDAGKLWIPRRTAHKRVAPNGFDFSVSEHIGAGETYLAAIIRGFQEELNLEVSQPNLTLAGLLVPEPNSPYFGALYLLASNNSPDYNRQDFSSFQWLSPPDLSRLLKAGEAAKDSLLPSLKFLD